MKLTRILTFALPLLFCFELVLSQEKDRVNKKIKKSYTKKAVNTDENSQLELFNKVYTNLSNSYVDSIDQSKVILAGIDGMLDALGPYKKILKGASKERDEM